MARPTSNRRKFYVVPTTFATRLEANRWLAMAGFGAATKHTDIQNSTNQNIVPYSGEIDDADRVMSIGPAAWLTQQFADNTLPSAYDNRSVATAQNNTGTQSDQTRQIMHSQAVHGSAQTRLKMIHALSQIFVVRRPDSTTKGINALNQYFDWLAEATLSQNNSSYRVLLEKVTYSYAMAIMLTYLNNNKIAPDQNYAREILQLFSIGVNQLNIDGTVITDSLGEPVPTYLPQDIPEFAKVFTGLGDTTGGGIAYEGQMRLFQDPSRHTDVAKVMFAYPSASTVSIPAQNPGAIGVDEICNPNGYVITVTSANTFTIPLVTASRRGWTAQPFTWRMSSDLSTIRTDALVTVVNGASIATITLTTHGLSTGNIIYSLGNIQESVKIALDYIFNHPNVGPFISKALIKFFVTSNPNPLYVRRIATVFNNNGNGVRGDLSAVVKAILLDREAILPYGINPRNFGRIPTITERIYKVARALREDIAHCSSSLSSLSSASEPQFTQPLFSKLRDTNDWRFVDMPTTMSTQPFEPPSVFNFFRPGFVPAGTELGDLNLTAPEFQLVTQENVTTWLNIVSGFCETLPASKSPTYSTPVGGILDNRFDLFETYGFEFSTSANQFTADTTTTMTGNLTRVNTTNFSHKLLYRKQSTGATTLTTSAQSSPVGPGAKSIGITGATVGDVYDVQPLLVFPNSGMPSPWYKNGANDIRLATMPHLSYLYKFSNLIPNTSAIPTSSDLNSAIAHLEDRLMTRPISTALRALMVQAAQISFTAPVPYLSGDTAFMNHYYHFEITYAQKRARHMLAVLLASPEFIVQN